jgi:2-amino-4-hydroxy-6-hydroxymethyldihydropteridine diphosphokinase
VTRAFVGLGSNLGDREDFIGRAVDRIAALPETRVIARSAWRETEPVGIRDQPPFLNGVVELQTELGPRELLASLLEIERQLGRERSGVPRGGPRTIDLDLLVYDDLELDERDLTVPHPRIAERRFALEPLADLDRALQVPGKGTVETLLAELDSRS